MQETKEKKFSDYQENILEIKHIIKGRGLLNNTQKISQVWVFENTVYQQKKVWWKTTTRQ